MEEEQKKPQQVPQEAQQQVPQEPNQVSANPQILGQSTPANTIPELPDKPVGREAIPRTGGQLPSEEEPVAPLPIEVQEQAEAQRTPSVQPTQQVAQPAEPSQEQATEQQVAQTEQPTEPQETQPAEPTSTEQTQ